MARMLAHARHSQAPGEFTISPVGAMHKLLAKTGWSVQDVDLFEINEAFAMVTMMAIEDLGLDHAKVNVNGGACAQGHPIGSTGSRIMVTLMYALQPARPAPRHRRTVHRRRRGHCRRHRTDIVDHSSRSQRCGLARHADWRQQHVIE